MLLTPPRTYHPPLKVLDPGCRTRLLLHLIDAFMEETDMIQAVNVFFKGGM